MYVFLFSPFISVAFYFTFYGKALWINDVCDEVFLLQHWSIKLH